MTAEGECTQLREHICAPEGSPRPPVCQYVGQRACLGVAWPCPGPPTAPGLSAPAPIGRRPLILAPRQLEAEYRLKTLLGRSAARGSLAPPWSVPPCGPSGAPSPGVCRPTPPSPPWAASRGAGRTSSHPTSPRPSPSRPTCSLRSRPVP